MPPGEPCDAAHIPSSNSVMLAAMLNGLPCAQSRTRASSLTAWPGLDAMPSAIAPDSDIIVTSGGASVGDHDLVQQGTAQCGRGNRLLAGCHASWKTGHGRATRQLRSSLACRAIRHRLSSPHSCFLLPLVQAIWPGVSKPLLPEVFSGAAWRATCPQAERASEYFRARVRKWTHYQYLPDRIAACWLHLSQANALVINPGQTSLRVSARFNWRNICGME